MNNVHDSGCDFEGIPRAEIEKAYTDILAVLSISPLSESALRDSIDDRWSRIHAGALQRLITDRRVMPMDQDDASMLRLVPPGEYRDLVSHPTFEPLKTIYEKGSVPGAHDHSVFALLAFYEMVGLPWEEARENIISWLEETGTWSRGGFEEATPAELVDSKQHVYDMGYGWRQAANEAKAVIDRRL